MLSSRPPFSKDCGLEINLRGSETLNRHVDDQSLFPRLIAVWRRHLPLNQTQTSKVYAANGYLIRMRRNAMEEVSGTPRIK